MKETITETSGSLSQTAPRTFLRGLSRFRPLQATPNAAILRHTGQGPETSDADLPGDERSSTRRRVGVDVPFSWTMEEARAVLASMKQGEVASAVQVKLLDDLGVDDNRLYNEYKPSIAFVKVKQSASMRLVNLRRRGIL